MPDDPPPRRSVREFCKHYGVSRNGYLIARAKAKVRPRDWNAMLSAKDQKALLEHISVERRAEQMYRHIREQPTVTKQFAPPPKPPIDYDAELARVEKSLASWRKVLIEFAGAHVADDRTGRCKRCREEAPCRTRRVLNRLDNELVEQVAIADSGDPADGLDAGGQTALEVQSERSLGALYEARNRWRRALVDLTMDHMIEDGKGRCVQCPVSVPCDISKVVNRINIGIARQIEKFACMSDGQREHALGERPVRRYYEDDDWDTV